MKKLLLICMLVAALILAGSGAWATIINFSYIPGVDDVETYNNGSPTSWSPPGGMGIQNTSSPPAPGTNWFSMITGSGDYNFVIAASYNTATQQLIITTGWGSGGTSGGGSGPAFTEDGAIAADLTLFSGGKVFMVGLNSVSGSADLGKVYLGGTPLNTNTISATFNQGGYVYGGQYGSNNPQQVPVLHGSDATFLGTTSVTWTLSGSANYLVPGTSTHIYTEAVDVDLSGLIADGFNPGDFSFVDPSATCANSVVTGAVPLPNPWLLMATSFLALNNLRRRKKQSSN